MPARSRLADGIARTPGWLLGLAALAVTLYALSVVHYVDMPLRIEENEWPPMAAEIFESGAPVLEAHQTHRLRFTETLQIDQAPLIGAWHPPLYLYSLAASMAIVGDSASYSLRVVGIVGLLVAALLLLLIAREVTPRWRLVGGIAAALLLVHPYAVQGSMFLDIDTSIYAPLALLVAWLAIRFGNRPGRLSTAPLLALGGALALVTWAKMTTTVVLVAVLVAWWLLSRRPLRRAVLEAGAFVAIGAGLFFATYALWCAATDIAFGYTFDVTFAQKSDRLFSNWQLVENAAHWHLRWFGAGVGILAAVYLVDLARSLVATRALRDLDLLYLFGVAVLVNYVLASPTDGSYQGKYAFPALAALLLPIVWMLLREPVRRGTAIRWAGAAMAGVVAVLLLPDVLTDLSRAGDYGSWSFELTVIAGTATALGLAWLLGGRTGFAGGVLLVLALLLVGQSVSSYRSGTSPLYPISDTSDFRAAAADLNRSTNPGDVVLAPKDLGFYIRRWVVEGEDAYARGDARMAEAIRAYPQIVAVARNSFGPPIGPQTTALIDSCFLDRRTLGTVTLAYRSKRCR